MVNALVLTLGEFDRHGDVVPIGAEEGDFVRPRGQSVDFDRCFPDFFTVHEDLGGRGGRNDQTAGVREVHFRHRWREAFLTALPKVKQMGFDNHFIRMWNYYLAYCEGGFLERAIGCVHLQFHKPEFRRTLA